MTPEQKLEFIDDLVNRIKGDIKDKVKDMPDEWDGHEVRWLIAEKFSDSAVFYVPDKRSKRYMEFKNTVLVKNL